MNRTCKFNWKVSAIALGVASMFGTGAAFADDEELRALTQPKSEVQVEVINVDTSSAKFGEYNGLNKQGPYVNGGLNVRGGSAYKDNESGGTYRWSVTGENLGLTSRSAGAGVSDQGSWSLGINYDELQHNTSDTYQTPYNGNIGSGGAFTLPQNLLGSITTNNNANVANDLKTVNISNTRQNSTINGTAVINANTNLTFEFNNLTQTGSKLGAMGFAGSNASGSIDKGNRETFATFAMPMNSQTNTWNLGFNWKGEDSHFVASYFGSTFKNTYNYFSAQAFATSTLTTNPIQTLSTMPDNIFNQINFGGGYDFSKKTKLTGNFSIGQNTQNQGFAGSYDPTMIVGNLPSASMNGLVNTTHADLKLTDQSIQDLALGAFAKYDNRDNLTQSNMYAARSLSTDEIGTVPNLPMSIKQTQLGLTSDYRLSKDQKAGLAYSNNQINRWCNQYGANSAVTISTNGSGSVTSPNSYLNSPNCTSATSSNENKLDATYKLRASEAVNLKASAGYANRNANWDQTAIANMPYQTSATGWGTNQPMGYNSGNYLGFQPFFEASRKQYVGKASADWQATDDLAFTLGGKYTNDTYPNSTYGVQNGNSWSLNLDGTYRYAETGSLVGYATQQAMSRFVNSQASFNTASVPAIPNGYGNNLQTNATTVGLGIKHGGLAGGGLTLMADAMMSFAKSVYTTNSYQTNCSWPATSGSTCGIVPGIVNNLGAIKLGGIYQIDKNSKVGLMYWYQHLYSNDYFYSGTLYNSTPTAGMPTNQSSPSYSVNVISANYTYSFD